MALSFNTAGPCIPGEHYMLPPGERLGQVMRLIEERKFFVLYAGHQTGKTTCVQWLVEHYNGAGRYACAWVDLETARERTSDAPCPGWVPARPSTSPPRPSPFPLSALRRSRRSCSSTPRPPA